MIARLARFVHNVVAHPLLELWPRVGLWLHEQTAAIADFNAEEPEPPAPVESQEIEGGWAIREPDASNPVYVEETWPPFEVSRVTQIKK